MQEKNIYQILFYQLSPEQFIKYLDKQWLHIYDLIYIYNIVATANNKFILTFIDNKIHIDTRKKRKRHLIILEYILNRLMKSDNFKKIQGSTYISSTSMLSMPDTKNNFVGNIPEGTIIRAADDNIFEQSFRKQDYYNNTILYYNNGSHILSLPGQKLVTKLDNDDLLGIYSQEDKVFIFTNKLYYNMNTYYNNVFMDDAKELWLNVQLDYYKTKFKLNTYLLIAGCKEVTNKDNADFDFNNIDNINWENFLGVNEL